MRRVSLFLLALSLPALARPVTYRSVDGLYQVTFPEPPDSHGAIAEARGFRVTDVSLATLRITAGRQMESFRKTHPNSREIRRGGYTGYEASSPRRCWRVWTANGHFFQLTALSPLDAEARRFFNSFRLLPPPRRKP